MDKDETWHAGRPRPGHVVLDGDPGHPLAKGHSPQLLAHICCGQMARWIKMPLGREVGLGPRDIVLDEDPAPLLKKRHSPLQFLAHVCCGQTAGWIKMSLSTMVANIVLDADPAPPPRDTALPPQISAHVSCGQTAGWIKMPLGTKVGLGSGRILLHEDPAPPPKRGTPPIFSPCILWPKARPSQLLLITCYITKLCSSWLLQVSCWSFCEFSA